MRKKDLETINGKLSVAEIKKITDSRKPDIRDRNKNNFINEFEHRTKSINPNEEFRVKDILNDHWDEMSHGLRRSIGGKIAEEVENGNIEGIKVSKKKNNANYYKVEDISQKAITVTLKSTK